MPAIFLSDHTYLGLLPKLQMAVRKLVLPPSHLVIDLFHPVPHFSIRVNIYCIFDHYNCFATTALFAQVAYKVTTPEIS